jgi:hypothetical protein
MIILMYCSVCGTTVLQYWIQHRLGIHIQIIFRKYVPGEFTDYGKIMYPCFGSTSEQQVSATNDMMPVAELQKGAPSHQKCSKVNN